MKRTGRVETVVPIQILRGFAAIGVVIAHAAADLDRFGVTSGRSSFFDLGGAGVDLFFIISGFVMVYASEPLFGSFRGATTFFAYRLIRIVPLYWLVTTFYLAVALLMPRLGGTLYPLKTIATSFLFIPYARPDGIMQPVLGQGWTLNYEMFFYVIFAIAVLLPRRGAVVLSSTAIVLVVIVGRLFVLPATASYWADPITCEFVLGMLLGLAYRKGVKLRPSLCAALVSGGIILLALGGYLENSHRALTSGVPAAIVVAGATFGRFSLRSSLWKGLVILGDASYALYLLHEFPLQALTPTARWLSVHLTQWLWLYMTLAVVASALLAVVVHYAFERPVTKALRRYANSADFRTRRLSPEIKTLPAEWKSL